MTGNIVLIGFMAVGKGRTARELAGLTDSYAIDSDDLIESLAKRKISSLFAKHGEKYFRLLERRTAEWLAENVRNTVISTGGGFVMVPNLNEIGQVIYLHDEFDHIVKAVHEHPQAKQKIRKRPLLRDQKKARQLYDKRLPLYLAAADHVVEVAGKSIKQVAAEIIERVER